MQNFKSLMNNLSSAIMGNKESKVTIITYEDAVRRISDGEMRRLQEAFKRVATSNSYMTKHVFCREVLGDLVPLEIAEIVYGACGGTPKGLGFKDLLSSLVVLTKGTTEERVKFIFGIYATENVIHRDEFMRFLQDVEHYPVPDSLSKLFGNAHVVDYEGFARWIADPGNVTATSISAWLLRGPKSCLGRGSDFGANMFNLSDDHETPTFYQTLAGVTHLSEEDIVELEKRYWNLKANSVTGKMDVATITPLVSPPLPPSIVPSFFAAIDENKDGHIDFKEMACGVSAAARGPLTERQKFCFKIFDADKDGVLSSIEQENMLNLMRTIINDNLADASKDVVAAISKPNEVILEEIKTGGGSVTLEDYLMWSISDPMAEKFLVLIYQICQIVLGLKPLDPCEEFEVVTAWLSREENRGLKAGQVWYLVSVDWWSIWLNYVNSTSTISSLSNSDSGVCSISGSSTSQSGSFNDTNSVNGSLHSSKNVVQRSWSARKGCVEASVATDASHNVVVTGINSLDADHEPDSSVVSISGPNRICSTSSLSLATMDSSRSTCSSTPSPVHSPQVVRKPIQPSSLQGKTRKPGAIDNSTLILSNATSKVPSLTNDGGILRANVREGKDYVKVPRSVWDALGQWYGVINAVSRQVIEFENHALELEMYPVTLLLYRHQIMTNRPNYGSSSSWAGMYGSAALSSTMSYVQTQHFSPPKRTLAYTASFSRKEQIGKVWAYVCQKLKLSTQDTRLDLLGKEDLSFQLVLDDEQCTFEDLHLDDMAAILIETRNKDQTWPEELGSLVNTQFDTKPFHRQSILYPLEKGLTGLNNLGNTCFMNSALQCVSNTKPLTMYFTQKMHMFELNRTNPLGMRGHIAKRYGDLVTDIWSGTTKTIAPLKLRCTIGKYAPRFSGFQQNDAQELLAFLLDGLHEDLNRVFEKPYVELKDSNNRPDVICAQEAWENHVLRNKSIIVDLFHGQLKSSVRCKECNSESVRFDPFNYLTLPLPMESYVFCDIIVIRQDGSTPERYGLLASPDDKISELKSRLCQMLRANHSSLDLNCMIFVGIRQSRITEVFGDQRKVKEVFSSRRVYAYELSSKYDVENKVEAQIKRIMSSSKNQTGQGQGTKLPPENPLSRNCHSRQSSFSSCNSLQSSFSECAAAENYLVIVHRKMIREEAYFLAPHKSRPILFGLPLVIPFFPGMTHLELYKRVWILVARLVSPLPSSDHNHAQDCDDSLGYEYPFILRIVMKDSEWSCGTCQWYCFCRGCPLMCTEDELVNIPNAQNICISIDWDPTALHLRYQTTQELEYKEDKSVQEALNKQTESVAFNSCLDTFTKEEELSEDEKYNCAKCGGHQLAFKKLQIWRLPPILIVHLKRFQLINGRWAKSHKFVDFPFDNFDPTKFLADVPRRTSEFAKKFNNNPNDEPGDDEAELKPLQDFHQHRLQDGSDPFSLNYRLYAIVCHSGMLGAGHYVSYAKGCNGKWVCFNDSSCKEVNEDQMETSTAYMLFYERIGLDCEAYMPRIDPKIVPIISDDELEAEENEMRRGCCTM